MSVRAALRAATRAEHERVDAIFSRFDLASADGYRRFLLAQADAFLPVETALDAAGAEGVVADWAARRRGDHLRHDLRDMTVTAPELFGPETLFSDKASMLGAIYVLEGSRLGGALLKRDVPDHLPKRFLEARQDAGSWRRLLELLDEFLTRPNQVEDAIAAAKHLFARFEVAGLRQLEA